MLAHRSQERLVLVQRHNMKNCIKHLVLDHLCQQTLMKLQMLAKRSQQDPLLAQWLLAPESPEHIYHILGPWQWQSLSKGHWRCLSKPLRKGDKIVQPRWPKNIAGFKLRLCNINNIMTIDGGVNSQNPHTTVMKEE